MGRLNSDREGVSAMQAVLNVGAALTVVDKVIDRLLLDLFDIFARV